MNLKRIFLYVKLKIIQSRLDYLQDQQKNISKIDYS